MKRLIILTIAILSINCIICMSFKKYNVTSYQKQLIDSKQYFIRLKYQKQQKQIGSELIPYVNIWVEIKGNDIEILSNIGHYVGNLMEISEQNFKERDYPTDTIAAFLTWYGGTASEIYITRYEDCVKIFERDASEREGCITSDTPIAIEKNCIKINHRSSLSMLPLEEFRISP